MANSAARMFLKNGKSFAQLLRSRLVDPSSNINVCNKDRLFSQSLINTTQQLYLQRPVLGDGFNFVDFVLGKDHDLRAEHWKSSPIVEARGERGRRYGSDDDVDVDDDDDDYDDGEFDGDCIEDFDDDDGDFDDDEDDAAAAADDDGGR